jgi:hypothetical protein
MPSNPISISSKKSSSVTAGYKMFFANASPLARLMVCSLVAIPLPFGVGEKSLAMLIILVI